MNTVYEYLDWRGDLTFDISGVNEVDALLFSLFNYVDIPFEKEDKLSEGARKVLFNYKSKSVYDLEKISDFEKRMSILFLKACKTDRFRNMYMVDKVEKIDTNDEMQFQATTFKISEDVLVVSFKGTDHSLLGFKEDFNMSFNEPVKGQIESVQYLQDVLDKYSQDTVYVVGHSKGGNFAVYSSSHISDENRDRIKLIYNFDGPGFTEDFLEFEGYTKTIPKIKKYVPKDAFVGVLMEDKEDVVIVDAGGWSGFDQHNGLSWRVCGTEFVKRDEKTTKSKYLGNAMNSWLSNVDYDDRRKFVDSVYDILTNTMSISDIKEFKRDKIKLMYNFFKNVKELDEEDRNLIQEVFMKWFKK